MIEFESKGSFKNTEDFLKKMTDGNIYATLGHYGQIGVDALSNATPIDTGTTSQSWDYEIVQDKRSYSIIWRNTNIDNGRPVAILIQYGHATGGGGWVQGRDYINPAIRPIFDQIAAELWKAVTA